MAGFDAVLCAGVPDADEMIGQAQKQRIILTRTRRVYAKIPPDRAILILDDDPDDQVRGIFNRLGIKREELKPLARCTFCNEELVEADRDQFSGRMPDYVREQGCLFHQCPHCGRIYWPGSHASRMLARLDGLFR